MGSWQIRGFTPDDYTGIVEVDSEIYPDLPQTVEDFIEADSRREDHCKWRRWVAEVNDRIVAWAYYTQYAGKYDPGRFNLGGGVLEEFQNQGIGTELYDVVVDGLAIHDPRELRAHAREDRNLAVRFLRQRDFEVYRREGDSVLEVANANLTQFEGIEDSLRADGIKIKTLRELETDPERDLKLYDLDWEVTRDEPGSADNTRADFETFVADGLNAPWRLSDGYFVAVCGDEYIGICLLNAIQANGTAKHGITGVKRSYRRRGLATALKVRAVLFAREAGIPRIYTDNEAGNSPMLEINEKLGFVRLPDWLFYEKNVALRVSRS